MVLYLHFEKRSSSTTTYDEADTLEDGRGVWLAAVDPNYVLVLSKVLALPLATATIQIEHVLALPVDQSQAPDGLGTIYSHADFTNVFGVVDVFGHRDGWVILLWCACEERWADPVGEVKLDSE